MHLPHGHDDALAENATFVPADAQKRTADGKVIRRREWKNVTGAGEVRLDAPLPDPSLEVTSGRHKYGDSHYVYARALMRREPTFEVEQSLERAIKLDPGYTEAYYVLGRYYTRIGDAERARSAFAKFGELRKNPVPSPFGLRR